MWDSFHVWRTAYDASQDFIPYGGFETMPTDDFSVSFAAGAEWFAGGMAVCEFLNDLADLVSPRCRHGVVIAGPWPPCRACAEECYR